MKKFVDIDTIKPIVIKNDHDGCGEIYFRRMFTRSEFESNIDFLDFTIIPSGSNIGYHKHAGNEEVYMIARGNPLMRVDGIEHRLKPGSISVVRDNEAHELTNDTSEDVWIFVVQVNLMR